MDEIYYSMNMDSVYMVKVPKRTYDRMTGIEERLAAVIHQRASRREPPTDEWSIDEILAYIWDGTTPDKESGVNDGFDNKSEIRR